MTDVQRSGLLKSLPMRLHHHAYVVSDHERTRHFYEDILGMPLLATWIEHEEYQGIDLVYCHTFYGLADGGALAFFNFADPAVQERFTPKKQDMFVHISLKVSEETQQELSERIKAANLDTFSYDHGYCKSIYVHDPDGLLVEFTVDPPHVDEINREQARTAHETLKKWLAKDTTPTNLLRHQND